MSEQLPFEDLFKPLVLHARQVLRGTVEGSAYDLLTAEAHADWENYLLVRLTGAGAKAAYCQFQVFKTVRRVFPPRKSAAEREANFLYREFVEDRPGNRLEKLFGEFPVLARVCDTLIKNWLVAVAEFLGRLEADRNALSTHFTAGRYAGQVSTLRAGLSDPHRSGRCVVKMRFASGDQLIYKPRSLAPEAHFSGLLDQLNRTGISHLLLAARCWDRGEYGWMENLEQRPCAAQADVHAYYWRAGVLLGLVYLARGVDFHRENLIAAGEFPVLIDLEALLHPQKPGGNHPGTLFDSVVRTGFLPQGDPQSGRYEWSGLSRQAHSGRLATTWVHVNQDEMFLRTGRQGFPNQSHLPVLNGESHLAPGYVEDIQAGFRWIGERLLKSDEGRAEWRSWLCKLAGCPRRHIVGLTARYQAILEQLTLPQALREEQPRLSSMAEFARIGGAAWQEEWQALDQLDIPYFEQTHDGIVNLSDPIPLIPSTVEYMSQASAIAKSLASGFPT